MAQNLPPLDDYLAKTLSPEARLGMALSYQDAFLMYICKALDIQVNGVTGPESGSEDANASHPAAGYTELIDPRLDNWRYFTKDFVNVSIPANNNYQLYPYTIDEWGSVLVSSIRVSSPDCRMTVKVYSADGQYLDINNTASELYQLGRVTAPTGLGLDLNKYDSVRNLYAFELRSPWPGLPFYKKVEIWLANETMSAITLYNATVTLIKLDK
jgi:hypothetical protein